MKNLIYFITIILIISCNQDKITKSILKKRSINYFANKRIEINTFQSNYYVVAKPSYKHYVLKYYRVLKKDSAIIWFAIDDEANYFIQSNDKYDSIYTKTNTW